MPVYASTQSYKKYYTSKLVSGATFCCVCTYAFIIIIPFLIAISTNGNPSTILLTPRSLILSHFPSRRPSLLSRGRNERE